MEWTREQREQAAKRLYLIGDLRKPLPFLVDLQCELTAALEENERLRQPVVTATGIIMSFVAYCAGNDRVPEHIIGAAKEWLKANDPSFGNPAKGLAVPPQRRSDA